MGNRIHDLINAERKKRGIGHVYWSREMARLAQSQANYCAEIGRLKHSEFFAFEGGENLAEGGQHFPPREVVNCWLRSKAGHREYLLSPRVRKAGVGVAKRKNKTFVAWAFSDSPPSYPDCPGYKSKPSFKLPKTKSSKRHVPRTLAGLLRRLLL
jgi:uncharacterized protein YkwD